MNMAQAPDATFRGDIARGLKELALSDDECADVLTAKLLSFLPSVDDASSTCQVCTAASLCCPLARGFVPRHVSCLNTCVVRLWQLLAKRIVW